MEAGKTFQLPHLVVGVPVIPLVSVLCLQLRWDGRSALETHAACDRHEAGVSDSPRSPETSPFHSQDFVSRVYDDFDQHFLLKKHPRTKHSLLISFCQSTSFPISLWGISTGMWNCQYMINMSEGRLIAGERERLCTLCRRQKGKGKHLSQTSWK